MKAESKTPSESQVPSLPCLEMRSKEDYYQDDASPENPFASGVFWCLKSYENFGPDGQPVGPAECKAGRGCFRSALDLAPKPGTTA